LTAQHEAHPAELNDGGIAEALGAEPTEPREAIQKPVRA